MGRGSKGLVAVVAVAWAAGCGLSVGLDPAPPPPGRMDASPWARDGGGADATGAEPDAASADAGPPARECVTAADCPPDPCAPGARCTEEGLCVPGTPRSCADDDYCTDDRCDPATGLCSHVRGNPCDDGDACDGLESCAAGATPDVACLPGVPVDCDDRVGCTIDTCDPGSGACDHATSDARCTDAPGGWCDAASDCQYTTCVHGVTCLPADACSDASCVGDVCERVAGCSMGEDCCAGRCVPGGCDDGNPCTMDACGVDDCVHAALVGAPCDDGDSCTTMDECDATGHCRPGTPRTCDDGNPCTADACLGGTCSNTFVTRSCDDGDPCTSGDACAAGLCVGSPVTCPPTDADPCTADVCAAATGRCTTVPLRVGSSCKLNGVCDGSGACVCASGYADCDRNGTCECLASGCTGTSCGTTDLCAGVRCGMGQACCPDTGRCYSLICLACCRP